jgi:DNA polymerase-3 subunit epsilon
MTSGLTVCFTGELQCSFQGEPITREQAHCFAQQAGLAIATNVSKKLGVLVVADPNSQSGKARKARDYGTRIMAETVFWKCIGVDVG